MIIFFILDSRTVILGSRHSHLSADAVDAVAVRVQSCHAKRLRVCVVLSGARTGWLCEH